MNTNPTTEVVDFITVEKGVDLIVSFAIATPVPGEVVSLTLIRTPKFEFALPDDERGVTVSHESFPREDGERLQRIKLAPPVISIATTRTRYELDVSKVDPHELRSAQQVLERMNFDNRFVLRFA